jgi:hypothetical protein
MNILSVLAILLLSEVVRPSLKWYRCLADMLHLLVEC